MGDAGLGHRLGVAAGDAVAVEDDVAAGADHPADGPERRGLAGAVGPEHDGHLALLHGHVDAVEDAHRPVPTGHPVQLEQRHG
jgi:hypothetical protein